MMSNVKAGNDPVSKEKQELTEEELDGAVGGNIIPYPEDVEPEQLIIGSSVWAQDNNGAYRWGTIDQKDGTLILVHFGAGIVVSGGEVTQVEEQYKWTGTYWFFAW